MKVKIMKSVTRLIVTLLPISFFVCVMAAMKYFHYDFQNMAQKSPSFVWHMILLCIPIFFLLLSFIVPTEMQLQLQDPDERLRAISSRAAIATIILFINVLFLSCFFLQIAGWQTIVFDTNLLPFIVMVLLGCIYCIAFAYYYYRMS